MLDYINRVIDFLVSSPGRAPVMARREMNYYGRRINQMYHQYMGQPDGYDLMEEDWDTAIILDSCRYDFFKNRKRLQRGTLEKKTSPGSESREFIERSFKGRKLHDTVYVTGNPYTPILEPDTFHKIYLDEAWDDNKEQVPARRVTDVAIDAHERHPNKRVIVHYMQPHLPILHPDKEYVNEGIEPTRRQYWPVSVTMSDVREGYAANLEYVLEYVEELLDHIEGKVVVTADHGELLGERQAPIPIRGTDHHPGLYVPELLEVPWLTITDGTRRKITESEPEGQLKVDQRTKQERLEALGYV